MKEAVAKLNSYRQSPRKMRLVATSIKGKGIKEAQNILNFTIKKATNPLSKLLKSAIENAKNGGLSLDNLVVSRIMVDGGKILYRRMPVAHGSAHPIRKRTSNITIFLSEKINTNKKVKK